ncbi:MAG: protease complex subunit PrcB family protein [Phycisphaeraceae bacterium]
MSSRITLALCGLMVAMLAAGCQKNGGSGGPEVGTTTPVPILDHLGGNDAGLIMPGVTLVNSAAELEKLGSQDLIAKNVDLDSYSLIVLSVGQQSSGGYWAWITGVQRDGDRLYVQGIVNRPAEGEVTTEAITHAYDAVVVNKISAATVHPEIESTTGQTRPGVAPLPADMEEPAKEPAPAAPMENGGM